jgi:hypothetical protein
MVYLPNVRSVPDEYREKGLARVRVTRQERADGGEAFGRIKGLGGLHSGRGTLSEMCVPLKILDIPYGVINLESSLADAFVYNKEQLLQIARNITFFWDEILRSNDLVWLVSNLRFQENRHRIQRLSGDIADSRIRDNLRAILELPRFPLSDLPQGQDGDGATIHSLVDSVLRKEAGDQRVMYEMLRDRVRLLESDNLKIGPAVAEGLSYILLELLRNNAKNNASETIKVAAKAFSRGSRNVVILRTRLKYLGPQSEINCAFISPIERPDGYHFGIFLVGVLVRNLGGRLNFDRKLGENYRVLEIFVPTQGHSPFIGVA